MDLDDETRAALGWGSTRDDREDQLRPNRMGGRPSRTPPGEVDGRSRQNWRRKRASATTAVSKSQGEAE